MDKLDIGSITLYLIHDSIFGNPFLSALFWFSFVYLSIYKEKVVMKQSITPLISIIVPVYKAEKYLHRCIDSILTQSYGNFELILIDDGSPDNSGTICDEYAEKDNRVKVIHQKNAGVSAARNKGLDNSQGVWVSFIDSDDYIEKSYYEHLIQFTNNDWIIEGFKTQKHIEKINKSSFSDTDFLQFWDSHFHRLYSTVPWGKLYKKIIIQNNNLHFDSEIRLGEDLIFNLSYIMYCKSIQLIDFSQYIYTTTSIASERYNLTDNEIIYIINKINQLILELNDKKKCKCSPQLILRTIIGTYPLYTITQNKIDIYYSIYSYCFNGISRYQFYEDDICSPIKRSIRYLKELIIQRKYNECIDFMSKIHFYFYKYLSILHYNRHIDTFIAIMIKYKMYHIAYFILFFFKKIK